MAAYFAQGSTGAVAVRDRHGQQLPADAARRTSSSYTQRRVDRTAARRHRRAGRVRRDRAKRSDGPQFRNGVRTGKLFTNLADAECDLGSGTYCEWRINSLDVYYQWETGAQPYNQFAAVKDSSGEFVNVRCAPAGELTPCRRARRTASTPARASCCSTAASATCGACRASACRRPPTRSGLRWRRSALRAVVRDSVRHRRRAW